MADITKCTNDSCPLSWCCWRINAPSGVWQAFHHFKMDENMKCEHFANPPEKECYNGKDLSEEDE